MLSFRSAGTTGSPAVLVHGFPETSWTFHKLLPRLSPRHRVFAADLRGFGDSPPAEDDHDAVTAAEDLAALIEHLDLGPVHLTGQDLGGQVAFRVAATRPELVRSLAMIEAALPGLGAERLADAAWHIRALATPGVPELLRGRALVAEHLIPSLNATPDAFSDADLETFASAYARPGGLRGAAGLYRSLLADDVSALRVGVPALAVGGGSGDFTAATLRQVADDVRTVTVDGVGHWVSMEAPDRLAEALLAFWD